MRVIETLYELKARNSDKKAIQQWLSSNSKNQYYMTCALAHPNKFFYVIFSDAQEAEQFQRLWGVTWTK